MSNVLVFCPWCGTDREQRACSCALTRVGRAWYQDHLDSVLDPEGISGEEFTERCFAGWLEQGNSLPDDHLFDVIVASRTEIICRTSKLETPTWNFRRLGS